MRRVPPGQRRIFLPGMWKIPAGEHCGEARQGEKKKEKPVKTKARPKKAKKPEPPAEDGYDGYYDDRLPIDEGHRRDGLDKGIIKKVAALVLCLLVVIGACLAILYVI